MASVQNKHLQSSAHSAATGRVSGPSHIIEQASLWDSSQKGDDAVTMALEQSL